MTELLSKELISLINNIDDGRKISIPKTKFRRCMNSPDIETMGIIKIILLKKRYYQCITPPLTFADYYPFMMHYYERCFRENPQSQWVDSRYSAGTSFVNWFKGLWNDPEVPRKAVLDLKDLLAKLYSDGDEDLRECIVTATLEHLLENRKIAKYFADWRDDPILKSPYNEALDYAKCFRKHKTTKGHTSN